MSSTEEEEETGAKITTIRDELKMKKLKKIKRKKKSKRRKACKRSRSLDSSDTSVSKKKKKRKKKKSKSKSRKHKKLKHEASSESQSTSNTDSPRAQLKSEKEDNDIPPGPSIPQDLNIKSKLMKPMTKEEWDKQQSVVRRVTDVSTGRTRLIKGDGEVLEEIVSKQMHKEINKQATHGDGAYFQNNVFPNA